MNGIVELTDKTLIDLLLEEEQTLDTPVGRFAEGAQTRVSESVTHSDLIPLTAPAKGEQFAFQVNLDSCSGCKGCVTACHSLNGLDEGETWRDVGMLFGKDESVVHQQTVTTACHHCVDPACLNGCPVEAYEKDPASGIVLHLDDQCIGCQYCVLKCPYDVPKYNERRGIVRKCDMCHSRLASVEAPACVQACPHGAIKIVNVAVEEARARAAVQGGFLPDSPEASYTLPSTRYVSEKKLPEGMVAADAHALRPQPAHWPLVGLLGLSQIGIGGFLANSLFWSSLEEGMRVASFGLAWLVFHCGLLCSVLHLGQPFKAWRIFLGFRHSWLSREALVFGACSVCSTGVLVLLGLSWFGLGTQSLGGDALHLPLLWASSFLGSIGALTSVYIYVDTRRSFWKLSSTAGKFFGSVFLGSLAFSFLRDKAIGFPLLCAFAATVLLKLLFEARSNNENSRSREIIERSLSRLWVGRMIAGLTLAALVPALSLFAEGAFLGVVAIVGVIVSESFERVIYFKAVNAPKMPGGING